MKKTFILFWEWHWVGGPIWFPWRMECLENRWWGMILKDRWTRMDRGWRRRISKAPRIVAYNSSEFSWSKGDDDALVHHYLTCKVEIGVFSISTSLRVATKNLCHPSFSSTKKKTVPISLQKSPSIHQSFGQQPTTHNSPQDAIWHSKLHQLCQRRPPCVMEFADADLLDWDAPWTR